MSAVRHTAIQRLASTASLSSRRISPSPTVHSSIHDDEKPIEINHFKQEKLNAGIRASEDQNYIEAIKQFSLIKPDTPMSLYLCGCARLSMNYYYQIQEAIVDFTKCLELSSRLREPPFTLQAWYKLAQAYHRIHRYEDALRDYTEFIHRAESAGEQGINDLSRGLVARGQTYQALLELDKALKDMNRANQLTHENNPYYLCCRASVYAWKDDKQKAEADLTKAAEIGYENDCEALLQRALVFSELDQHQAAVENLERAFTLEHDPVQLAEISYRLGLTEYALNKKMQAIRSFEQATNCHPFHSQAYYYLGKIQAEKGHHKQALKALNRAQDLSPQQPEILLERAMVNRVLGNLDDANADEKRATQLTSTQSIVLIQFIERIKKLKQDIAKQNHPSAHQYFELATMFDGLLNLKKRFKAKIDHHQDAVAAYRRCIELDSKYQYPQARALLILCYQKMNGIVEAHELHLRFYDQMDEHPEAINRWKTYLVEMTDKLESGQHELYLNENSLSRLIQIEFNRRKKDIDEEKFRNDTDDKNQNQLTFYRRLRLDLSHILASIAILNLDHEQIISTNQQTSSQLERYIDIFKKNITFIDDIQSILMEGIYTNRKAYNSLDPQSIRMKLNGFARYMNDTIDYIDVSQLVARHLCTRYRSQLLCLNPVPMHSVSSIDLSTVSTRSAPPSSSSSWWSCCKSRPSSPQLFRETTSIDQSNIIERIALFAIAFVMSSINRETNRMPSSVRTPRKDVLATRLVLMMSRAHHDNPVKYPLRIDQSIVSKMLQELPESEPITSNRIIEWNLYEFFRAPGIYYETNDGESTSYFYASGPSMKADIYGYRLGTLEEIDSIKMKSSKKRF